MNPLEATTPDLEIDEFTGKLQRKVQLMSNSMVYNPLNRNLLYTKAEIDAKLDSNRKPKVVTLVTVASLTPDITNDLYVITAQGGALAVNAPTGIANEGQRLTLRIKDDGTARAITWDGIFRAIGFTMPSTTVISKLTYVGFMYNGIDNKWDGVALSQQ